jgi:hypothetical protein
VRIHFPGKHALEFELLDFLPETLGIGFYFIRRA